MSKTKFVLALVLAFVSGARASDRVVAMPTAFAGSQAVSIYEPLPLELVATPSLPDGTFRALTAAGRYYFLSATDGRGYLSVTGTDGSAIGSPIAVGTETRNMAVTPDGSKLLVLDTDLSVFNITQPAPVLLGKVTIGNNPVDLGVSHDSRRAYIATAGDSRIVAVDLTSLAVRGEALALTQAPLALAVAPNGLVYVSAREALYEIDGRSASDTAMVLRHSVRLDGGALPTRAAFTPDGLRLVTGNNGQGAAAYVFEIQARRLQNVNTASFPLRQILVASNYEFYGVTTEQKLYSAFFGEPEAAQVRFLNGEIGAVTSITASGQYPDAPYLYVATDNSSVTRASIWDLMLAESAEGGGRLATLTSGAPGPVTGALSYNLEQTATAGDPTLPMVVRFLDVDGRPVSDAAVTWNPPAGVTALSMMTRTNQEGYAQAIFTTPAQAKTYLITASIPGTVVTFSLTAQAGGGSGGGEGRLTILSGQGQIYAGVREPPEKLTVQLRDSAGRPVAGGTVSWEKKLTIVGLPSMVGIQILGSPQSACTPEGTDGNRLTCTTDADGISMVELRGLNTDSQFAQVEVTASVPGANAVFYESFLTALSQVPYVNLQEPTLGQIINAPLGVPGDRVIKVRVYGDPQGVRQIPNARVRIFTEGTATGGPSAHCKGGMLLTDAFGLVNCEVIGEGDVGAAILIIEVGGYARLNGPTINVLPGPPVEMKILAGDNQSAGVGVALAQGLQAEVRNAAGVPQAGQQVIWEVIKGSATLSSVVTTADPYGRVSAKVTLGNTPGEVQIRVRSVEGTAVAIFRATAVAAISSLTKVSGDNQIIGQEEQFAAPLVVQVNSGTAPLAGATVTFSVVSGTASLSNASVTTNNEGKANVTVVAGSTIGQVVVKAAAGTQSVTFSLAIRKSGPDLKAEGFLNGASFAPGIGFGSIVTLQAEGLLSNSTIALTPGACAGGPQFLTGMPTRVAGFEIVFGGDLLAPIFHVCRTTDGKEQLTFQLPFEIAPSMTTVEVRTGMGGPKPLKYWVPDVQVFNAKPGVFRKVEGSKTIAVAIRPDGSYVSPDNKARKGEILRIFATGLGPVLPGAKTNVPGYPGQVPYFTPVVLVNGEGAAGVLTNYATNLIGIFEVSFSVPANAASGDAQLLLNILTDKQETVAGTAVVLPIE